MLYDGFMTAPWTRGDVLDLHILILLIIWMLLDRFNIYFSDIVGAIINRVRYDRNGRRPC